MAVKHDNAGDRVADVTFDAVRVGAVGIGHILDGDQIRAWWTWGLGLRWQMDLQGTQVVTDRREKDGGCFCLLKKSNNAIHA